MEKSSHFDKMLAKVGSSQSAWARFLAQAPYSKPANRFFCLYRVVPVPPRTYDDPELPPQRFGDRIGCMEKFLYL